MTIHLGNTIFQCLCLVEGSGQLLQVEQIDHRQATLLFLPLERGQDFRTSCQDHDQVEPRGRNKKRRCIPNHIRHHIGSLFEA